MKVNYKKKSIVSSIQQIIDDEEMNGNGEIESITLDEGEWDRLLEECGFNHRTFTVFRFSRRNGSSIPVYRGEN